MSVILEHVSKAYGRQKALDDIGFRLEEGEICGFLGPNGAGKSTTMKIITGCLNDYQGEVRIKEMNLRENPLKIKAIIGYLPEQNPLYPDLYIREYLLHVARLYRVGRPVAKVNAIIERTGLEPEIQKKIGRFCVGYVFGILLYDIGISDFCKIAYLLISRNIKKNLNEILNIA